MILRQTIARQPGPYLKALMELTCSGSRGPNGMATLAFLDNNLAVGGRNSDKDRRRRILSSLATVPPREQTNGQCQCCTENCRSCDSGRDQVPPVATNIIVGCYWVDALDLGLQRVLHIPIAAVFFVVKDISCDVTNGSSYPSLTTLASARFVLDVPIHGEDHLQRIPIHKIDKFDTIDLAIHRTQAWRITSRE